ncbi:MAG: TMEM208 family protein [Bacteroidales bacterium]|nr:TMEM208 family protein [Bacteroidales bacterium]
MDTKERHVKENEGRDRHEGLEPTLPAEGRERKRENTKKLNNLWIWFGVLILIAILLYWIFSIGLLGDMEGTFNG